MDKQQAINLAPGNCVKLLENTCATWARIRSHPVTMVSNTSPTPLLVFMVATDSSITKIISHLEIDRLLTEEEIAYWENS
jgi:hypothetical protein